MATFAIWHRRFGSSIDHLRSAVLGILVDQSTVRLLCQDILQTCLSVAAVDALERVGHAKFRDAKPRNS